MIPDLTQFLGRAIMLPYTRSYALADRPRSTHRTHASPPPLTPNTRPPVKSTRPSNLIGGQTGREFKTGLQGENLFRVSRPLFPGHFQGVSGRRGNIRALFTGAPPATSAACRSCCTSGLWLLAAAAAPQRAKRRGAASSGKRRGALVRRPPPAHDVARRGSNK